MKRFWLILCMSLQCLLSCRVFAEDINVTSPITSGKILDSNNHTINITGSGSINCCEVLAIDGAGVVSFGSTNWALNINATSGNGIVSTETKAVFVINTGHGGGSNTGVINLNSGIITSAIPASSLLSATIVLQGGITSINVAEGSVISNTSTDQQARAISSVEDSVLLLENSGTISSSFGSALLLLGSGNATINNYGLISGSITNSGYGRVGHISINNVGTMVGEVGSSVGSLKMTNSGSITGDINLGAETYSYLTTNAGTIAGNVTLGATSQNFNLNGGTLVGNTTLASGSSLNIGSGILNGSVNGSTTNAGTLNINQDFTLNSAYSIGQTNSISSLNIASGKTFVANGLVATNGLNIDSDARFILGNDVTAANTNLYGTLDFGDSARTFTGNILGEGSGKINVGGVAQTVNGNVTLNSGDTFNLKFFDAANVGKLVVSGVATVNSGVKVGIDLSSNYGYIANGSKFTVIDGGAGSVIKAVSSSNVNVNSSGSNQSGVLIFTTSVSGDDLVLDVSRKAASEVSRNKSSQNIYNVINDIGSAATGDLKALQQYLDTASVNQANDALEQVAPQDSNSIRISSIAVINSSLSTIESRLESVRNVSVIQPKLAESQDYGGARLYQVSYKPIYKLTDSDNSVNEKIIRFKDELKKEAKNYKEAENCGAENKVVVSKNNGIWGQAFGANTKQKDLGNNDGYKSQAKGLAFGYDRKFDKDTILGVGFSYANSQSKSSDVTKRTNISTYQLSAYSEQNFGKYFLDNILGFALNDYNSSRVISAINKVADGDYLGRIYIAKVRGGFTKNLGHNFVLIPELSSTFNHAEVDSYTERGAGDLNLRVKKSSSDFLEGRGGFSFGYKNTTKSDLTLFPKISASYGYNFLNKRQSVVSNFVGQAATFNTTSSKLDPRSLKLGASLDLYHSNSSTFTTEYVQERRNNYRSNYFMLRTRIAF